MFEKSYSPFVFNSFEVAVHACLIDISHIFPVRDRLLPALFDFLLQSVLVDELCTELLCFGLLSGSSLNEPFVFDSVLCDVHILQVNLGSFESLHLVSMGSHNGIVGFRCQLQVHQVVPRLFAFFQLVPTGLLRLPHYALLCRTQLLHDRVLFLLLFFLNGFQLI